MQKNVSGQHWVVFAFDETDNTAKTGDAANITANLRIDGGAANAVDDTNPAELEDGYYIFDITQAESNGDLILICPVSSTANIQVIGVPGAVWTRPPNFPAMGIESDGDVTKVNALDGHTVQTGDSYARIGAPAGLSIAADLVVIDNFVDELESRLTALRAGYLDNLSAGGVAQAATALSTATWTAARAGYLDELAAANVPADVDTLLTRITAAVALASVCTEARLAELDAANLPTDIADIPTVAEFEARTIVAANYFDPANDTVVNVTNCAVNADMVDVAQALVDIHLDHLLAVDYDPASKPGVATALLNELVENDSGVSRFTENALEQAPSGTGGDATEAKQDTIITHLTEVKGAGFVESIDSNEAIRNRGDAAWITGGGAGGSSTVIISVVDGDSAAIQDCSVQIWNSALDSLVSYATSDSNGQVTLSADDDSYKVKLKKGGYSFTDPEDLTVSGNTSITYTGSSTIPSAPASVQSCRVYDYLFDPDGTTPLSTSDVKAIAKIISLPEDANSILHSGIEIEGIYNVITGLVYWDIVKGAEVEFVIMNFGIKLQKTIPTTDTARLSDIA